MKKTGVLVVDDNELIRGMLSEWLQRFGYGVTTAESGPAALSAIAEHAFDLVLLDVEMPGMSGLQALSRIREQHSPSDLPVIMVSGLDDSEVIVAALGLGANDYITKPLDLAVARARIDMRLSRRRLEAERVRTDALTDLPNRMALDHWWSARKHPTGRIAGLCLNLDRFRTVNNGLGRPAGDRLLIDVAARLKAVVPTDAFLARLQGDDFVCFVPGADPQAAAGLATRILEEIRRPFDLGDRRISITASVGIASRESGSTADEVLTEADTALYVAKTQSGDRWDVFDPSVESRAAARLQLEMELKTALEDDAFAMRYQPIISLRTSDIIGFEALARWNHPERGELGPAEFIPIAEETGLIVSLGLLWLRKVCRQLRIWQQADVPPHLSVGVNISTKQLSHPSFVDDVHRVIEETGVNPSGLVFEVTESLLMEDVQQVRLILDRLVALGVRLSLDDFGTGYSSLNYLQHFAFSALKIDRSFIRNLTSETDNHAQIVRAIVQLAQTLKMDTVAEGIETLEQLMLVRALGLSHGQGFLFARAGTVEAATDAIRMMRKA